MIRAMITGSLHGDPQTRTSQAGNPYVTAKVRADGKDGGSVWCSIIAFGEQAGRLMTLGAGAALAVSGKAELNGWLDKQGEPKAGLSLVVEELATLKAKPRPQDDAPPRPPQNRATRPAPASAGPDFNDDLPDFM